jgi:ribosomal protein L16 Arg81 hydroxylase
MDDFVLRAGDMLYMPRGVVHDALTSDSVSLHVTLGINTYTYADLLFQALDALFARDVRYRRALPLGFAFDRQSADRLRAEAAALVRALAEGSVPLEETIDALAERFVMTRPPMLDGYLAGLTDAGRLTLQSRVRKRAWLCRLTLRGDTVQVLYHGKGMTFPRTLEPTFRFILETDVFAVAALPGPLSEKDKVRLAVQLVEEGFLTAV